MMVKVLTKGIIVIPKKVREKIGISEGSLLSLKVEDGSIILTPAERNITEINLPYDTVDKIISSLRREELKLEG